MVASHIIIIRLLLAIILGSLIGIERGRSERAAGFRTHALVSLGSCLFMLVSELGCADVRDLPGTNLDPSRIAAQVVSGIGFLGAGMIIFWREKVRGLTTAASVWTTAAIGLAIGSGLYLAAGITTLGALIILSMFKSIERRITSERHILTFRIDKQIVTLKVLEEKFERGGIAIEQIAIYPSSVPEQDLVELRLKQESSTSLLQLVDDLRKTAGIHGVAAEATLSAPRTQSTMTDRASDSSSQDDSDY